MLLGNEMKMQINKMFRTKEHKTEMKWKKWKGEKVKKESCRDPFQEVSPPPLL